jgi:hypothetical protein
MSEEAGGINLMSLSYEQLSQLKKSIEEVRDRARARLPCAAQNSSSMRPL